MKVDLEQGSQEWLDLRKGLIGASEVPMIMGTSPYSSISQLMDEKLGFRAPFSGNWATRYGSNKEEEIRIHAEQINNDLLFPEVHVSDTHAWLLASLDGISIDGTTIYELKACNSKVFAAAKGGRPVDHHYDQIQAQLIVCEFATKCVYVACHRDQFHVIDVYPDPERQKQIIDRTLEFYERMQRHERYKEEEVDDGYITIDDEEAIYVAERMETALELKKSADTLIKDCRPVLLNLTDDGNCYIGNLSLTRSECKGSIDWEALAADQGIDADTIEKYRKPGTVRWTIKQRNTK